MVRKQIHITKKQEQYLKHTTNKSGHTEAEIVRRALDEYIRRQKDE